MAVLGTSRRGWAYTDDGGTSYAVSAETDLVSQTNVGGSGTITGLKALPPRFRMRKRYVSDGTVTRAVTCYSLTAPLWTDLTATVNLMKNSVSTTFTPKDVKLGEKENGRRYTAQTS
jgi:hypothetical protein